MYSNTKMSKKTMHILPFIIMSFVHVGECCLALNVLRSDFKEKCQLWWDEAKDYSSHANSAIMKCVMLIDEKCPEFLKIVNSEIIKTAADSTRIIGKAATHMSKKKEVVHFSTIEGHGLCEDKDNVQECDTWWGIALHKQEESTVVQKCFDLVRSYCSGRITLIEQTSEMKLHNLRRVEAVTKTYYFDSNKIALSRTISFTEY